MTFCSRFKSAELDLFFDAILSLETHEECYRFFEDVTTITEIRSLAQRFQVAKMLLENKTYSEIADSTGVGTATISRVKKCLHYGVDGYKLALKRILDL